MLTKSPTKTLLFVVSLFLILTAFSSASAASRVDYVGAWMNDDPDTRGITRILIQTSGTKGLEVNAFGKCTPMDCDWGTASAIFYGDPFVVSYASSISTRTLTISLLTPTTMHIRAFYDYPAGDPRPDRTEDYYFHLMTKPDFVIREVIQPSGVLEYGIYNWLEFSIQNLGAPYNSATPLRAQIVNKKRNGVSMLTSGYMEPTYTLPIETGQKVNHRFAIGHSSAWSDGDYTFNLLADYDRAIDEEIETNNLSRAVNVTIMGAFQMRGFCNFNNYPMSLQTSMMPWWQLHIPGTGLIPGAEFRYYPISGRYAISGVPESEDFALNMGFLTGSDQHSRYPGNFAFGRYLNLAAMTPEQKDNYALDMIKLIHLTGPWENTEVSSSVTYPEHQPGILFKWDAVSGATEYLFEVDRYRSLRHPSGFGYIDKPINIVVPGTEHVVSLPNSDPNEFYRATIIARNGYGQKIGEMYRMLPGTGFGWDYRFTVDHECYTLPKLRMFVDKRTSYDVSGTPRYRFNVKITNLDVIPEALFVPAPDLPACGLNTNASRTYVRFYDENDAQLGSYCAVYDKNVINGLSFSIPQSSPLPKAVKMVLEDRRCETSHDSIYVDPWYACPIGDLNGDCIVNIVDLSLMATTWLDHGDLF